MKEIFAQILILTLVIAFNSCNFTAGVFKAGMGFGIFLIVALVLGLVFLVVRFAKK